MSCVSAACWVLCESRPECWCRPFAREVVGVCCAQRSSVISVPSSSKKSTMVDRTGSCDGSQGNVLEGKLRKELPKRKSGNQFLATYASRGRPAMSCESAADVRLFARPLRAPIDSDGRPCIVTVLRMCVFLRDPFVRSSGACSRGPSRCGRRVCVRKCQ